MFLPCGFQLLREAGSPAARSRGHASEGIPPRPAIRQAAAVRHPQLRMKPSSSPSAQASVFSMGFALVEAHAHLGQSGLRVDLLGDLRRGGRRGDRQHLVLVRVRVVIQRALRRTFLGPDLQRGELLERRAGRSRHWPRPSSRSASGCDRCTKQALGRFLVLGELPDAPEVGKEGREAALRTDREAVGPALLGDLRRVALGDRPGARRVHDQGAPAGDQPLVVGGVVPGRRRPAAGTRSASCRIRVPGAPLSFLTTTLPLASTSSAPND